MALQLTPYVIPSFLGGLIAVALAVYTWQRRAIKAALPFSLLMAAVAAWSLMYVIEIAGMDLATKFWAAKFKYFGTTLTPIFWVLFTFTYANREKWLTRPFLILLFSGPFIGILLMFTTEWHGLVYRAVALDTTQAVVIMNVDVGSWYWINVYFSYVWIFIGMVTLLVSAGLSSLVRWQTATIFLGCLVPVVVNYLHLTGRFSLPFVDDPTPFSFALGGLFLVVGIFRYRLFDIVPIAQRTVWNDMKDVIFAVDRKDRLVTANPAAVRLLGVNDTAVIGQSLDGLADRFPALGVKMRQALNGSSEFTFQNVVYELRVSNLNDDKQQFIGRLFAARDITARKQAEYALQRAKNEVEVALHALEIEQQKSEDLLLNILPPPIAQRLKDQEKTIADNFDEVTILFADIVNFTPVSANQPAVELVNILNDIFSAFDDLADKYHVEKIKTIGDAYMVVGGLPLPQFDHAEKIADMALDMMGIINQFTLGNGRPLNMRIGINSGPVVAGVIGRKKFIYDLWGDAVNLASRMESHGLAGVIQVAPVTYLQLKDKFYFEERGPIQVKGKGAMPTYLLQGRVR